MSVKSDLTVCFLGYTGHVPNSRDAYGVSYGKITSYHWACSNKQTKQSANNEQFARNVQALKDKQGAAAPDENESKFQTATKLVEWLTAKN